jgi:hypothetical protein
MVKVFKNEKSKSKVFESYDNMLKLWNVKLEEDDIDTTYGITHCIKTGSNKITTPFDTWCWR